jgi:hypothetical protein
MSLSKRIAEYKPPKIGGECRTCTLLADLPKDERDALQQALDDPRISNAGLSRILKAEGYQIADSTVRRHRKGECKSS